MKCDSDPEDRVDGFTLTSCHDGSGSEIYDGYPDTSGQSENVLKDASTWSTGSGCPSAKYLCLIGSPGH